jgi:hypothetical protein
MTPRPAFAGALPQQMRVSSCTDSTHQSSPDGHVEAAQPARTWKLRSRDAPMVLFKLDDWRRHRTGERPSEAATGSSRWIVNRVRRDPAGSPVIERVARTIAGPGEVGWNPVDAHTRQEHPADPPSIPSKGMPPGEGTFPFPAAMPKLFPSPKRISRSQWSLTRCSPRHGLYGPFRDSINLRKQRSSEGAWCLQRGIAQATYVTDPK